MIEVTVVPKSGRFSISVKDKKVKIFLKSAAEQNKANHELVKELSKLLGKDVRIASGLKSKLKRLEIDITEEEWENFLESYK
jgi:uncharacterized protein (TIGR00251 family)